MFHKAPRLLFIRKLIAYITIAQFALSTPSAAFAQDDHLRPSAAKNSARVYDVRNALKDGGMIVDAPADYLNIGGRFLNVQSNMAGLYVGPQTGGTNTRLAYEQGSNGNLDDHSENRERLEGSVKDMVIAMMTRRQQILDATEKSLQGQTKAYNLITAKIVRDSTLNDTQRQAKLAEAQADSDALVVKLGKESSDAISMLEGEYFISTKAQMSRLERSTGLNADNQKLVLSWVRQQYASPKWNADSTLDELIAQITNRVKNQELQADVVFSRAYYKQYGRYPYKVTTLCLGEKKSQYDENDPTKAWRILERDLRQMLDKISREDAKILGLRLAYEPRWVIGAETIPPDVLAKINDTHGFIKKISKEILSITLAVDYGAAVKSGTIESIIALPNVDGVLIGSAANDPATLQPIIEKALVYVRKTGKVFNLGINWKASDSTSGLKELDAFVAMLKSFSDLNLINITIATPNVRETRTAMDAVERYFSRVSLSVLGAKTDFIEDLGNGFTKVILARTEKSAGSIEAFFGEESRPGDVYMFLKKNGTVFALAKENKPDQTLMVVPVDDMAVTEDRDVYYANLLESVSRLTSNTNTGIELIVENGDLFKRYLAQNIKPKAKQESFSFRTLAGMKYWYGRERFFQMEYKPVGVAADVRPTILTPKSTERALGHGVSFIIQPKYTVLINGYGTIGAKAAAAARKSGFLVMASARSVKIDSRDAFLKDYPIVLTDAKNAADFEKQGMNVAGSLTDVLAKVDVVIDATPAKVGAQNLKDIYSKFPDLRVIFEGGEKAAEGVQSFSSRTNFDSVRNSRVVRVVSCNTTGMSRLYGALAEVFEGLVIDNLAMRRASDPGDEKGENPDGISIVPAYHHGPDLRTVLSESANAHIVGLNTDAAVTPTTHFHVHHGSIRGPGLTVAKVQELFKAQSRVALVEFPGGELKTPILFDIFNSMIPDANHPFIIPVQVKASSIPGEIKVTFAVPQESNVVPENVNALQSMLGLFPKDAAIRLVNEVLNIEKIKDGLEKRLPAKIQKDGGEVAEVKIPIDYLTLDDIDAAGRTALYRGDFNSPVKDGKLSITERLRANAPTIKELKQKGAKVVIMVHQGRKGDADYLENLQQYADLISELIGAPVGYVDDLYGDKAVNAIKAMKNGDVLVLKNVRSWDPESDKKMTLAAQSKSAMIQALQQVIDLEVLDAFSIAHRNNISVVGFEAAGVPLVAGRLMEKEIKGNYRAALVGEKPYIASFGGAKIDDYLGVIRKGLNENIYTNVHTSGLIGELALVAWGFNLGKPTTDFLEEQFKGFTSKKYGNGMQAIVKEIQDLLSTYGGRIEVPIDLAYLDANGKRVEVVLTAEHKTKPVAGTLIGDIGTQTANKYAAQLKEAKTVFVKGPWGNYKNIEFMGASEIIANALKESKAYLITGGGDTNVLFERLGMMQRINYFSLAGGAFLEFMEGKALPGLVALDHSAKTILAGAQKFGVSRNEFLKNAINDKFVYTKLAGNTFNALVSSIEKAKAPQKGELSKALWSAEVIKDSRGKDTVRAELRIGDTIVEGFVPAGTSTGADEANTVDPSQAVINIVTKIGPMLASANLDLSKHEDLVKADRMLQEAAGDNFRDLGANATLPVSWAMWDMAAKLHNMPLWLYFRMYEPRAVGKGKVYNSFNFGNGGEHAMKDKSERLGIDRMFAQEVKYVTVGAKTERESLAEADTVDQIYKKKLIALAGAENVTRALERGLTAKGIADIYVMTDLLIQSGIEAGIEAGKKPGIDFRIAVDFASNSVYNPDTKRYFINEKMQLTAPEMRKFLRDYADFFRAKYHPDIFLYFEDPLAENEWDQTAILTPELKERGILLTGDDLFVTQVRKVAIGVEMGAGTAVLIKPNQVGTITGMIDTVEYAHKNGLETVFSHRSGETLDKKLADAAKGFLPLAIKTGAPQPESEYPNPKDWERRNKYLRKIEIQEKEAMLQKALVIGPEFFTAGGGVNVLKQALALNKQVQFVLYGESMESVKALLGDVSILTAPTLMDAVALLKSRDVPAQNIVLLGSATQKDAEAVKDIKQIPVKGIGTIALAQALNALIADEATQAAFASFDRAMSEFTVNDVVAGEVEQAIREQEEFFNKV